MEQIEFENRLRTIKNEYKNKILAANQLLGGVREEIAYIDRQIAKERERRTALVQEKQMFLKRICEIAAQRDEDLRKFYDANRPTTRTLQNVGDLTLAKELYKRGFRLNGVLESERKRDEGFMRWMNNFLTNPTNKQHAEEGTDETIRFYGEENNSQA